MAADPTAPTPFKVTSFHPDVNGEINSIAFNGGNCAHAYIGGQFTSVNGTAVANLRVLVSRRDPHARAARGSGIAFLP